MLVRVHRDGQPHKSLLFNPTTRYTSWRNSTQHTLDNVVILSRTSVGALSSGRPLRCDGVGDPFYVGQPMSGAQPSRRGAEKGRHTVVRIPGSSIMDAAQAAVSSTHALLVTRGGDVYSWGERGFDDEACVRSVEGLANHRCREVACGQGVSLALTDQGTVFTWGNGSVGMLGNGTCESTFLPKPIRHFFWSGTAPSSASCVSIKQISSGPFHCAAVSGGAFVHQVPYDNFIPWAL